MVIPYVLVALTIGFAALEVVAAAKKWRRVELIARPAATACLFLWLYSATGLSGPAAWFGAGLLCALVGGTLLVWEERGFLPGMAAFLLAQISYLIGFSRNPSPLSLWSLLLAFVLGVSAARVLRRLIAGIHQSGKSRLARLVMVYGMVITLMLLSAMLTLSNTEWDAVAAPLAAAGAFLIYMSGLALGWSRFVGPVPGGRMLSISAYEAGQLLLAAGVVMQYGR